MLVACSMRKVGMSICIMSDGLRLTLAGNIARAEHHHLFVEVYEAINDPPYFSYLPLSPSLSYGGMTTTESLPAAEYIHRTCANSSTGHLSRPTRSTLIHTPPHYLTTSLIGVEHI